MMSVSVSGFLLWQEWIFQCTAAWPLLWDHSWRWNPYD